MKNKLPFKELVKFNIQIDKLKELEQTKMQYDLMVLQKVIRAHVSENSATIIGEKNAEKEILKTIKKPAKVLNKQNISYTKILEQTFNK